MVFLPQRIDNTQICDSCLIYVVIFNYEYDINETRPWQHKKKLEQARHMRSTVPIGL